MSKSVDLLFWKYLGMNLAFLLYVEMLKDEDN